MTLKVAQALLAMFINIEFKTFEGHCQDHLDILKQFVVSVHSTDPARVIDVNIDLGSWLLNGARRKKTWSSGFANNKGTDRPALPSRLISAFIFRLLESIFRVATSEISIF